MRKQSAGARACITGVLASQRPSGQPSARRPRVTMTDAELEQLAHEAEVGMTEDQALTRIMQFIPSSERYLRRRGRGSPQEEPREFDQQHAGDILAVALITWTYRQLRRSIAEED